MFRALTKHMDKNSKIKKKTAGSPKLGVYVQDYVPDIVIFNVFLMNSNTEYGNQNVICLKHLVV